MVASWIKLVLTGLSCAGVNGDTGSNYLQLYHCNYLAGSTYLYLALTGSNGQFLVLTGRDLF